MSGTPSEAEIQTQWRNVVDMLEDTRAFLDGTVAGAGGQLDVLMQSLEGEFTPSGIAGAAQRWRGSAQGLVSPATALGFLEPILLEYRNRLSDGGAYTNMRDIAIALREHFVTNSLTVESRAITYDVTASVGSNTGNGAVGRLTIDQDGFPLEACTVETKTFRCRRDQNSGVPEFAEQFEVIGTEASPDSLLRASYGSGIHSVSMRSLHAGSGDGGSWLTNSSFSTYSSTSSPKFQGWTESAGGSNIVQSATIYRSHPGAQTDASLRINGGGGTVTLKQGLASMRFSQLDPNAPYFLRVMVNASTGTATGGNFIIRLGGVTVTTAVSDILDAGGWYEITVPFDANCWFRVFNEPDFDIEIEWASSTSGYLLVDDVIFAPWTFLDGTYWVIRGNHASPASWAVDDTLAFTDTGGAAATAKIQYWLWVAGLGYLPSTTGSPTFTEP